jgi:murein DD-endopeptidase MepM/ murein hydrolase activator NlpD
MALAVLLLLPVRGLAANFPLSLRLVPPQVKQGGVAALEMVGASPGDRLRVRVGNREIPATALPPGRPAVLWIGVDLEQPAGLLDLQVEEISGTGMPRKAAASLRVLDAAYPVQRLTVPRAFTELDPSTLERVNREKAVLDRIFGAWTPQRLWHGRFRLPIDGEVRAAGFGLRRIINGEPRAPHTGADFAAPAGAPVLSANAGTVALAEDHFFAGKSLVLDHGQGLYTMYFHLQTLLVVPGQRVERGDVVAHVGSTGRVTGPHLHWGARLNGARINPEELLRIDGR